MQTASKTLWFAGLALASVSVHNVLADDIETSLPITAATVHPYTAVVSRQKQISLPAGEHRLSITGIPAHVDPGRLQLSIPGNTVRLGSLDVQQDHAGSLITEKEKQLQNELQSLQDSRREITDTIETAKTELQLLASLASGGSNAAVKPTVASNELANLISTIGKGSDEARTRIRDADKQLRDLDKQIEQKQFELDQVSTNRVVTSTITAQIQVTSATDAPVTLIYPENNAGWSWLYEARLNTDEKTLGLFRQAVVRQGSGEDWTNIELTLTTADQRRGTTTPVLNSQFIDVFDPRDVMADTMSVSANRMESELAAAPAQRKLSDAGTLYQPAQSVGTQFLAEYKIPGRTTIPANRQDKILPIDDTSYAIELMARAVPTRALSAFLEARFTYTEDTPLQAGRVQLYRDGAFMGNTAADTFLPDQEVSLPFGIDERIRVAVKPEEEESRTGGMLRRTSAKDVRNRYEITSYHANPIDVEVVGQIPVPRNTDITVEIADDATPATEKDLDGKAGLLLWKIKAEPQKMVAIKHYYSITYPKDKELTYQ